jgi:hypothetical protein
LYLADNYSHRSNTMTGDLEHLKLYSLLQEDLYRKKEKKKKTIKKMYKKKKQTKKLNKKILNFYRC